MTRIESLLETQAQRLPDKPALIVGNDRWTYADVALAVRKVARTLTDQGVCPGERVLIQLDNCAEAVVSLFGALHAGAVFCMVNPTTKAEKLAFLLRHCDAKGLITKEALAPVAARALAGNTSTTVRLLVDGTVDSELKGSVPWSAAMHCAGLPGPTHADASALASILYTSGTTGMPKGVMLSHENVLAATRSIAAYLENVSDDVLLGVLPLSFGYGLSQIYTAFLVGATVVLEKSFAFPFATLQRMAQEGVTGFALVPTMAALLVQARELPEVPALRYVTNAAAPLPVAHVRTLRERFPRVKLFSMYGMTECTRACYLSPDQLDHRPHSVGRAIPGTQLSVVDESGNEVAPGVVGELVVRGPHVMQGYWADPIATANKLRKCPATGEIVLLSGDLFRRDEEGYLYFVSRQDDVIKTRGEKVSPKEVENVLYLLPGVREAVVYGTPDPLLGQAVVAAIVPIEEGCLTVRQVLAHCTKHLEDVMVPRHVEFRRELPHTDNGKIRRMELQAATSRSHGAQSFATS